MCRIFFFRFGEPEGFLTFFQYLELLSEVLSKTKMMSHLRNTCRRLRIVSLVPGINLQEEEVS